MFKKCLITSAVSLVIAFSLLCLFSLLCMRLDEPRSLTAMSAFTSLFIGAAACGVISSVISDFVSALVSSGVYVLVISVISLGLRKVDSRPIWQSIILIAAVYAVSCLSAALVLLLKKGTPNSRKKMMKKLKK